MAKIIPFYIHLLKCEAGVSPDFTMTRDSVAIKDSLFNIRQYQSDPSRGLDSESLKNAIRFAILKGVSNHPSDKGGLTIAGITTAAWKAFRKDKDIVSMTAEDWMHIVKEVYWNAVQGDQIENQELAEWLADYYFHSGNIGIKKIQIILGVKNDGILGPITLLAINSSNTKWLLSQYKRKRVEHLVNLASASSQGVFLKGWMNRLVDW